MDSSIGLRHNENGPAIEYLNKSHREYYIKGNLHRLDGPTKIIGSMCLYYIDGKEHSRTSWIDEVNKLKREKALEILKKDSLDNKTAVIDGKEYKLTLITKE